jgi:hypothetical protein
MISGGVDMDRESAGVKGTFEKHSSVKTGVLGSCN